MVDESCWRGARREAGLERREGVGKLMKNQIAMANLLDNASVYTGTPGGLRPRAAAHRGGTFVTRPAPDSASRTPLV